MNHPIRILNMFTIMDRGGAESMVMNYYRHIDRTKIQFDFMVHRQNRGAFDNEIEALGGRIYRMSPIYPQYFGRYKKELKTFFGNHPEYKIIHSHMSELGYFAFCEAERHEIPVRICHAHNAPVGMDLKMIVRNYFKSAMMPHITDLFICSQASGNWLYGEENKHRFVMMNNAIDTANYTYNSSRKSQIRTQLGISDDSFVVGHIGRFATQKNHSYLIDIFNSIASQHRKAVLLLVGDGNLRSRIEAKVTEFGLQNRVIFTGVRSDVADLLQAMDVFVFPSNYEGLPVTLVEAQASGLPCFISDKVPYDCVLTDLVTQVPLDAPPKKWAEIVMSAQNRKRRNTYNEIVQAGFDIKANAMWLEAFYLSHLNMEGLL